MYIAIHTAALLAADGPSPQVLAGLAGAFGAIAGSTVGAATNLITTRFQNRSQLALLDAQFVRQLESSRLQHERERLSEREKDAERRALEAAGHCYQLLGRLHKDLPEHYSMVFHSRSDEAAWTESHDRARGGLDGVLTEAAFLPTELRLRIAELHQMLGDADDFGQPQRFGVSHYHSKGQIVRNICRFAQLLLASYIRCDVLPVDTELIKEYRVAHEELMEERESDFAEEVGEENDARHEWRSRHSELLTSTP